MFAITAFAGTGARGIVHEAPEAVKFKVTAIEQHLTQLRAGALDARFCARDRDVELAREFDLGDALHLCQEKGVTIIGREGVHETADAWCELFRQIIRVGFRFGNFVVQGRGLGLRAIVVGNDVARNLKNPRSDFCFVAEGFDARVDS